ncbi:energy-coupling factor transporter transmembrane protein EcfT [Ligilactobacillus sp. WILCCON 0076]|uniref:Energy-coupling factor transporter transmembrane protein EcfT n=1 Tax=Ligilactobacillus ubinensis TaxID=2876789 RepID=A0A9X2FJP9_9LACO|nr:energy-coupling factor transporter transmembrane protein EcfT [Ligilactobacillus ubinensis]MCP0886877.1 energy-coupling factor transporter transmembrane protein EcfT [Ligilactobacillus ubinensis]
MDRFILGRYINGDSLVHKLDARDKLIISMYFIVIIFLANNWQTYSLLLVVVLGCVGLSRINLGFFLKGVSAMIWLIIFTVLLQVFFTSGGTVYWHWGILTLTHYGIVRGVYVFCRFVLIIFMSTLLTLTTSPLEISDGLESLMKPLKYVKVPVYEIALMLSIALRFVPTLMDETQKIMNAQRSRGVNFGQGKLIDQIKAVIPLLIPLFVSAINRAEDLAIAMEARGYHGGEGRSKYRQQIWHLQDTLALGLFAIVTVALLFLRTW